MLNTTHFILLAGNPEPWDEEVRRRCQPGKYENTFKSEDLCRVQADQSARGRLSAELVLSQYGWTVRYGSGLQNFSILYKSDDTHPQRAYNWGVRWANEAPDFREFYVRKFDIERAEQQGIDCSILKPKS